MQCQSDSNRTHTFNTEESIAKTPPGQVKKVEQASQCKQIHLTLERDGESEKEMVFAQHSTTPAVPAFQTSQDNPIPKRKENVNYKQLTEKYAEILKCAQNYDMEKHQRKLKKMEERKQAEEHQQRKAFSPSKKTFMNGSKYEKGLLQGFERIMNQYKFDDLKQLQNWVFIMAKNNNQMDNEQMKVLFGVDMNNFQSVSKVKESVNARDFFEACYFNISNYTNNQFSQSYRSNLNAENAFGEVFQKAVHDQKRADSSIEDNRKIQTNTIQMKNFQNSPYLINQQCVKIKQDGYQRVKIGKRPLNIKILNDPSSTFQSNFEPKITKIVQRQKGEGVQSPKRTQQKKNLDLSFTKSDFFFGHTQNQLFKLPMEIIDDAHETLENSPSHDNFPSHAITQSRQRNAELSKSFSGTLGMFSVDDKDMTQDELSDGGEKDQNFNTFQQTSKFSIKILQDDNLVKQLQTNEPIKQIFRVLNSQYLAQLKSQNEDSQDFKSSPNISIKDLSISPQKFQIIENNIQRLQGINTNLPKDIYMVQNINGSPLSNRSNSYNNIHLHSFKHNQQDLQSPAAHVGKHILQKPQMKIQPQNNNSKPQLKIKNSFSRQLLSGLINENDQKTSAQYQERLIKSPRQTNSRNQQLRNQRIDSQIVFHQTQTQRQLTNHQSNLIKQQRLLSPRALAHKLQTDQSATLPQNLDKYQRQRNQRNFSQIEQNTQNDQAYTLNKTSKQEMNQQQRYQLNKTSQIQFVPNLEYTSILDKNIEDLMGKRTRQPSPSNSPMKIMQTNLSNELSKNQNSQKQHKENKTKKRYRSVDRTKVPAVENHQYRTQIEKINEIQAQLNDAEIVNNTFKRNNSNQYFTINVLSENQTVQLQKAKFLSPIQRKFKRDSLLVQQSNNVSKKDLNEHEFNHEAFQNSFDERKIKRQLFQDAKNHTKQSFLPNLNMAAGVHQNEAMYKTKESYNVLPQIQLPDADDWIQQQQKMAMTTMKVHNRSKESESNGARNSSKQLNAENIFNRRFTTLGKNEVRSPNSSTFNTSNLQKKRFDKKVQQFSEFWHTKHGNYK